MAKPLGVHLVGSTGCSDTAISFKKCSAALPQRLKRIPDGETGKRYYFVNWQSVFFAAVPEIGAMSKAFQMMPAKSYTSEEVAAGIEKLKAANPRTGYEDAAIESYAVFKQLRDDGVIEPGVKFQVCLPSTMNVIGVQVQRDFQSAAEPVYEAALFRVVQEIQAAIPHEDLSIQIDLAVDTAFWEDLGVPFQPWFFPGTDRADLEKRKEYMVNSTIRLFAQVAEDVELGVHNCYGDIAHSHFMEPKDLGAVSERGLALFGKATHPIKYWHLPVPVSAMERLDAFFEPLKALIPKMKEHNTELYLGVVQAGDLKGTKARIEAAKKALGDFPFGVATECGLGRTPPEEIDSTFELSKTLSEPVM